MSTTMHGFVECDTGESWELLIDGLSTGVYDMMGCLFGVRNDANFDPVAPNRGWPDDSSDGARQYTGEEWGGNRSWISLAEVEAIDWDEAAEARDDRVSIYDADGERHGKAAGVMYEFEDDDYEERLRTGERVTVTLAEDIARAGFEAGDEMVLVHERRTRGEVRHAGYERIFDAMCGLGRRFGDDGVRLLVTFSV